MLCTPPNWNGLSVAAVVLALVLAVAALVPGHDLKDADGRSVASVLSSGEASRR